MKPLIKNFDKKLVSDVATFHKNLEIMKTDKDNIRKV